VRARRRIAQDGVDELFYRFVITLDVNLDGSRREITNRARDREMRCVPRNRIPESNSLHAAVQLEDDAPYALTSAREPFAARSSIPVSP
jgi:hypothetical protein